MTILQVEVGQQLFAKTTRDTGGLGAQDVKASILLGSKGNLRGHFLLMDLVDCIITTS